MKGLVNCITTARCRKEVCVTLLVCTQITILLFTLDRMCQLVADNRRRTRLDDKLPDDPSRDDSGRPTPTSNADLAFDGTGSRIPAPIVAPRGEHDTDTIREDGWLLLNDLQLVDAGVDVAGNASLGVVDRRVPDNAWRLERLGVVVRSAKYQLQEISTREELKPVVAVLSKIVRNRDNFERRLKSRRRGLRRVQINRTRQLDIFKNSESLDAWQRFHNGVNSMTLYSDCDSVADDVLRDMKTLPIFAMKASNPRQTSQMHFFYQLQNRAIVLFKPKRVAREYETPIDVDVFHDLERHTAEIAAFHLDRILGFRRVPPTAGRKVDVRKDISDKNHYNATGGIYVSRGGHDCFDGVCEANCDDRNPVCADDDGQLEGSMSAEFPIWLTSEVENPFHTVCLDCSSARSFADFNRKFGRESDYCTSQVRTTEPFKRDRSMLHLIDIQIFDFLIGNLDRHHLCVFDGLDPDSFFVTFDNGKGFRSSQRDELNILAPLYQCCLIRLSTLRRLLELFTGPDRLSDVMRRSLKTDLLRDVLTESHLNALDRRLATVLREIYNCLQHNSEQSVVIGDNEI